MKLENLKKIKKFDKGKVAESIALLPDQIRQVLDDARLIKIPREYSKCTHIVFNGMGGSNLGARILKTMLADQLKVPMSITPGYGVPAYVGKDTLYIISSYSGTTEEPLSTYKTAVNRGAKIVMITMDDPKSAMFKIMMEDNVPGYIFKPGYNPSNQPRLGVGYTIFGTMVLLAKAGMFEINVRNIEQIIAAMEVWGRKLKPEEQTEFNAAKQIAAAASGRIPVFVASEFLAGNLHAIRNQVNECSKQFATYLSLPDLNHYAMEGLSYPKSNKKDLVFIFFDSGLYSPRIQKRAELTKKVVAKNGVKIFSCRMKGETKMAQAFELLQLGSWISFYLGILNGVDPVKIPWVDWFKKQLK